jgi:hypothetical protein
MIHANAYTEKEHEGLIINLAERESNFFLMRKLKTKNPAHLET